MQRILTILVVLLSLAPLGCSDPCEALAERICNCELTSTDRAACRADRITSQQGTFTVSDANRAVCTKALDTCTCTAIDDNRLDLCGYTPEAPPPEPK